MCIKLVLLYIRISYTRYKIEFKISVVKMRIYIYILTYYKFKFLVIQCFALPNISLQ